MVQFVFAPQKFPQVRSYKLVKDEDFYPLTGNYLKLFARMSMDKGSVTPDAVEAEGLTDKLVISSSKWPWLVDKLKAKGVREDQIIVMLHPFEDYWGYIEVGKHYFGQDPFPANPSFATDDLRPHMLEVASFIVEENGGLSIGRDFYLSNYKDLIEENRSSIDFVRNAFADDRSREAYDIVLRADIMEQLQYFTATVFNQIQYTDFLPHLPNATVLNGGVHVGFELPYLMALTDLTGTFYNIDPLGMDYLSDFAEGTHTYFKDQMIDIKKALWNTETQITIPVLKDGQAIGKAANSGRDAEAWGALTEISVPSITLDNLVAEQGIEKVDLIKLDLEGAEPQVMEQWWKTVEGHRPHIAISIYHEPDHMWQIPKTIIDRLGDSYSYHLAHYSYQRWECIFYAIPKN